jgi:hypothetical protein
MKCFNHQEFEAVGVCRNCSKTVCRECLFSTEFPLGVVCSEKCFERVEWLVNSLEESEKLKLRNETDRLHYKELVERNEIRDARMLAENDLLREKNSQLYANLSGQELKGFYFCGALSAGMFGYGAAYAAFFDWYFCIGMGTILLVFAFNAFNKSGVYKKYAQDN